MTDNVSDRKNSVRYAVMLSLAGFLVSCGPADHTDTAHSKDASSAPSRGTVIFHCPEFGPLVTRKAADRIGLWLDGSWTVLSKIPAASGLKFENRETHTSFWQKGRTALLRHGENTHHTLSCEQLDARTP